MVFAAQFLVHTVQEADFAAAHADIAGRNIHIRTDVAPQFQHESLAETHDFRIGFALGVEVGTALSATHRKRGQGILEGLFETEELQDGRIHGRMETQTALVGTDGVVELDTVAGIHLHLSFIIDPRHAEGENTVGFDDALDDLRRFEFRMFVIHVLNGLENLLYSLQVFFLCRVLRLEAGHNLLCFHCDMWFDII